jgi:glycerate 2-kinase
VAIGKAAGTMAAGLRDVLGNRITKGIICGPIRPELQLGDWLTFSGGHPLPNQQSIAGAQATVQLLSSAAENALVIFLISGGGSAMFELPVSEDITLEDLREANRQLVSCGAAIAEVNAVRQAYSAVKGGKLAAIAPRCNQITLIISDTNPRDAASVASGPTLDPDSTALAAVDVVKQYGLEAKLPASIMRALAQPVTQASGSSGRLRVRHVLLNNSAALAAAALTAQQLGFVVEIATDISEQEIESGCDLLLARAHDLSRRKQETTVCLISGGEFSCPVSGNGVGGRNLETVLRCVMKLNVLKPQLQGSQWAVLSAGTDGIDGNSPVAGAVADETTIRRAVARDGSATDLLAHSDSFHFFDDHELIVTGPTGTNVRDVRVVLLGSRASRPQ